MRSKNSRLFYTPPTLNPLFEKPVDVDEAQLVTDETAVYPTDAEIEYLALGLGEELGEIFGLLKKSLRNADGQLTIQDMLNLREELGDLHFYWTRICKAFGFKASEVINENQRKLFERKANGTLKTRK